MGCQSEPEHPLSAWTVAEWVIGDALSEPELDLSARSAYINESSAAELSAFSAHVRADGRLGMLSARKPLEESWRGLYGYVRGEWTLGLWVNLIRVHNQWQISALPDASRYRMLVDLIERSTPDQDTSLLPWVDDGALWEGGLIGRDLSGRSLSAVPLVWAPPLVMLDGLMLPETTSREKLSAALGAAFKRRASLALAAQAVYRPHVALAIPAQRPASELTRLMAWVEGAGAEQVSLIARSERGPALLYLAGRAVRSNTLTSQQILHARVNPSAAHFMPNVNQTVPRRVDQKLTEVPFTRINPEADPMNQPESTSALTALLERHQGKRSLSGVSLAITPEARVVDVVSLYRLLWIVDAEVAVTLQPTQVDQARDQPQ